MSKLVDGLLALPPLQEQAAEMQVDEKENNEMTMGAKPKMGKRRHDSDGSMKRKLTNGDEADTKDDEMEAGEDDESQMHPSMIEDDE